MATAFKLYKLIILYMLNRVDFPLTSSQLSEFILDKGYTDFFKFQQTTAELTEEGFIREESTHNRTFYHLTEEGAETIAFFQNDISPAIRKDIDEFLNDKRYELKNEVSTKSDYYTNTSKEYAVHCQVVERETPLIDLTITVPTEAEAQTIANNWAGKSQEIYALIMSTLLK